MHQLRRKPPRKLEGWNCIKTIRLRLMGPTKVLPYPLARWLARPDDHHEGPHSFVCRAVEKNSSRAAGRPPSLQQLVKSKMLSRSGSCEPSESRFRSDTSTQAVVNLDRPVGSFPHSIRVLSCM